MVRIDCGSFNYSELEKRQLPVQGIMRVVLLTIS